MRQTAKYTAGIALARSQGASVRAGVTSHEALYDTLEAKGYWWNSDAQKWTDAPKPSTSVFADDGAGDIPSGVVKLRIMTHPNESDPTVKRLRELLEDDGFETLELSKQYENRRGIGVRVYLTVLKRRS